MSQKLYLAVSTDDSRTTYSSVTQVGNAVYVSRGMVHLKGAVTEAYEHALLAGLKYCQIGNDVEVHCKQRGAINLKGPGKTMRKVQHEIQRRALMVTLHHSTTHPLIQDASMHARLARNIRPPEHTTVFTASSFHPETGRAAASSIVLFGKHLHEATFELSQASDASSVELACLERCLTRLLPGSQVQLYPGNDHVQRLVTGAESSDLYQGLMGDLRDTTVALNLKIHLGKANHLLSIMRPRAIHMARRALSRLLEDHL